VQEKEMRYAGRSSYPTVESIEVSFILSADKSYIYDICIEISHLKGKVVDGIKTTTVTVDKTKETYSDRRNIDYESVTEFIKLGPSELKNLYFEGETAFLTLDYTYVCNTIPGGGSMDFPFGTTTFVCEGQPVGDEFISAKEMRR
jgi:allantoicase